MKLSHVDNSGKALMVDISGKMPMHREAIAAGKIILAPATLELLKENRLQKGDVLAVARIAAIQGGKKTAELIPLCHPLAIHQLDVQFQIVTDGVEITVRAVSEGRTGIEMEALTAVSIAALAIYDMCKAVDKNMIIGAIALLEKSKREIQG
ncbi:MAG: cyclic pyranopterin monophosphate synthase MoaC [Acidobacteriota bacterium]|jgi:cyclic pyranopterin phosphate synthase|nr:cyclic pyranopterin monophosphate synthase MoaC [Acidobacteriota bacterium]